MRIGTSLSGLLIAALAACAAVEPLDPAVFDERLRERTVDYYFDQLGAHYPYFDRLAADWNAVERETRKAAVQSATRGEFVRVVARALAQLEDPHLSLELPFQMIEQQGDGWTVPRFEFVRVGGRFFVTSWAAGEQPTPPPGAFAADPTTPIELLAPELVDIDDCPPSLGLLLPMLAGPPESSVALRLGWPDGSSSKHVILRLPAGESPPLHSSGSVLYDYSTWISWARVDTIGYLHLSTFTPSEQTGPPEQMLAEITAAFEALRGVEGLILDLQYNSGGGILIGGTVAEYLVQEPTLLGVIHDRRLGFIPWKTRVLLEPREGGYDGPLVVLLNGYSASMSEHLARVLSRARGAVLIGERTAGAEAAVRHCAAPDGSVLSFGEYRTTDDEGRGFQGVGLLPDREVPLTIEALRTQGVSRATARVERERIRVALEVLGSALPTGRIPRPPHPGFLSPCLASE